VEGELVARPSNNGAGEENSALSYTKIFWDALPQYMAMGMTTEEYFNGDSQLAKAYRESFKLQIEKENEMLWLQGMYTYQAILLCAPRLNSIKPQKPADYPKKPFEINSKKEKPKTMEEIGFEKMKAWMEKVNKHYAS